MKETKNPKRPLIYYYLIAMLALLLITFCGGLASEGFDRLSTAHFLNDTDMPTFGPLNSVTWFGLMNLLGSGLGIFASGVLIARMEKRGSVSRTGVVLFTSAGYILCLLLFGFGWARPVPVNISNFKNRRTGMAVTALAGPVANFVTAFAAYCLYFLVWVYGDSVFMQVLGEFLAIVASMSVGLGVFNLIPVHPLDGSRVLDAYLPFSWSLKIQKYQPVIILLFVFALWRGWLDIIMMNVGNQILGWAARFISLFL